MGQVNYTLQYRPISELVSEVELYLQKYNSTAVVQPSDIIDAAWKCTYDLGLRIFHVYEEILEIYHYNAKLPDSFFSLNYAFLCNRTEEYNINPSAPTFETIPYEENINMPCDITTCDNTPACNCSTPRRVCTTCNNNQYEIVQTIANKKYTYKSFTPIRLKHYSGVTKTCDGCPNINVNSPYEMDIRNGYIYTNLESGNLYINYMSYPMDDYGNMLIPDHPYINDYYKYAAIRRIVELLVLNGTISGDVFKVVEQRYRESRNNAVSFVNTPNFSELRETWKLNRRIQYAKYYEFFKRF